MSNNLKTIVYLVDFIENHLDEKLNLESLSKEIGYSKYHVHRMFTSIVGFTPHTYVQRRRLTESARLLIFSDMPIIEISIFAGYETQQSFTAAFTTLFKTTPQQLRMKKDFYPLQLKFSVNGKKQLRGDMTMDIRTIESPQILLLGYEGNTENGFEIIGDCMKKIVAAKSIVSDLTSEDCYIGLNDYSQNLKCDEAQPSFNFYGALEVMDFSVIPEGMVTKELPQSKYVVFSLKGKPQDSLQPVAEYIYKEWFPQSTCEFNEKNMYDFSKSFEAIDADGNSVVEYWVPIL